MQRKTPAVVESWAKGALRLAVFLQNCHDPRAAMACLPAGEQGRMRLKTNKRLGWVLAVTIAILVTVVPVVRYRWVYRHAKRFREVAPGLVYRSGWMSAPGFIEAVDQYKIRTVINLMEDEADPRLFWSYFFGGSILESELCKELKITYINLAPDLLSPQRLQKERPASIEEYLRLLDDPKSYPVLLHCRAGLHRTGIFTAIYRMEYQGWTPFEAWREMKANGFGEYNCFADNPYITQYILNYLPGQRTAASAQRAEKKESGVRNQESGARSQEPGVRGQESEIPRQVRLRGITNEAIHPIVIIDQVPPLPRP
jgi:hypothetical protein